VTARESTGRKITGQEPAARRDDTLAIAWASLPPYAIACIQECARQTGRHILLVGTSPDTPYDAVVAAAGVTTAWVDPSDITVSWERYRAAPPHCFLVGGWHIPAFNTLAGQVRRAGGRVALMMDNRWRGDLRQRLAPLVFRTRYRGHYSAALVPGTAAREYAIRLGMPADRVFTGMYGADPAVFRPGPRLVERPKRFLFVGRLEERKGVRELYEAWRQVHARLPEWELRLIGCGPLRDEAPNLPRMTIKDFQQPTELAPEYRGARFLVLPSHEDHWGLVVHEAALAGCGLVLSRNVGARLDLASDRNAIIVEPRRSDRLAEALLAVATLEEPALEAAAVESVVLASGYGPSSFASAVEKLRNLLVGPTEKGAA
jgi:glycosyltransferase involved in cell wall biosynthesis